MHSYSDWAHQQSIKERLGSRHNGYARFELSGNETIPSMFDKQVARHPHKSAIVCSGVSLTYRELDQRSRSIGAAARRVMHGERTPFALLIAQPIDFVAATLGVLRAGESYVPLDPAFPEDRNARILQESRARYIVTERAQQHLVERIALPEQTLIFVDELMNNRDDLIDTSTPSDLAYIMFTSGSTGRPKGVMQSHRNTLEVVRRYTQGLYLGFQDRVSLLSSCSVTASVGTIFGSLLNGATLCAFPVREEGLSKLADWLDAEHITVYRSVPSLFRNLMESVSPQRIFPSVQIVRLGGDSLYLSDWQLFTRHFLHSSALINFYGCSEISTVACYYTDAGSRLGDGVLPVGYPLGDVEISVVDDDGSVTRVNDREKLSAPVATGDIIVKSRHLSPGYWNDPAATDAAFTSTDCTTEGIRSYRTGDLGSVRPDQGLVHAGRGDAQVKISGFRVELADVEACLRGYPGVRGAAVVVHGAQHRERELMGFVELEHETSHDTTTIRNHVHDRLPTYMVPSRIIAVGKIPCTPNGKVDRAALIQLSEEVSRQKFRQAPRTLTEEALSEIWKQVLSLEHIGVEENFFELGGNSVLGMKLIAKTVERFAVPLRVLTIFQHPTISEMAQLVDSSPRHASQYLSVNQTMVEEGTI